MLRGERNMRRIKMVVVVILILAPASYGYLLFEKHKIKIIEFQQRVEDLQEYLQEAEDLAERVGETAYSIRNIFEGHESNTDNTNPTETVVDTEETATE